MGRICSKGSLNTIRRIGCIVLSDTTTGTAVKGPPGAEFAMHRGLVLFCT